MQFTLNSLSKTLGKPIDIDLMRRRKDCFSESKQGKNKSITAISLPENSPVTTLILNEEATQLTYLYAKGIKNLQVVDFQHFAKLEYLDLSNCGLTGDILLKCDASNLKQIYLQRNKITSIRFIGNFPTLKLVDICNNQLNNIEFKGDFKNLNYLYLNDNQLKVIDLADLKNLKTLHLQGNQFRALVRDFNQPSLETLRLANNPLPSDIKHFAQNKEINCLKDIRTYFVDLDKGSRVDNECKVLLLGNGAVGKSCLVKRLVYNLFQEKLPSTHGIALEQFQDEDYLFNLWDFGGQDIYHATHRLFLQSNALYLVLWDLETEKSEFTCCEEDGQARQYENHKLHYWLHYVKNRGKDSPVIVVQTKSQPDALAEAMAVTTKIAPYSKDFNLHFERIDSKLNNWDSNGYNRLLSTMRTLAQTLPISSLTPENRYDLRQTLRTLQKTGKKKISLKEYLALANAFEPEVAIDLLKNWLVSTGVVFYRDRFGDEVILDQAWAINAIYTVYRRTSIDGTENATYYRIQQANGQFTGKILQNSWKKYDTEEQNSFTKFMLACELCFETTNRVYSEEEIKKLLFEKRQFIAPQMMSEIMPESIEDSYLNQTANWYLNYEHELWHYGILQSFIVKTQSLANTRQIWQLGILLKEDDKDYALVSCRGNTVHVRVTQGSKALLNKIRNLLDDLQNGQDIKESVSVDGTNYISLEELKAHPRENPKILSKQGNWLQMSDFNAFLNRDPKDIFEPKAPIISDAEKLILKIATMTLENLQEAVRQQIKRAKPDKAIELIEQWAVAHNEAEIKNGIAKIQGDWKQLQTEKMQGTIDSKDKEIQINKIHFKLLNIKDMTKPSNDVDVKPDNNQIPEPSYLYALAFVVVCISTVAAGATGVLPFEKALLWLFAVLVLVLLVCVFELARVGKLSQENFMIWMKMFFAKIPGLSIFFRKPIE